VAEHGAFAGLGQDDELVAEVAADRAGVGAHRHRLQAHAREQVQIGHEHAVVGLARALGVEVEAVGVLHQELAAAHHAEARAALVAELPLDVVEVLGQVLVALHRSPEDLGDHFLVGGPVQQLALVAVDDAQHLGTVGVVAARLAPQVGQLQGRHQQLDGPGPVHLLADDLLDLVEHLQAQRQPGVDARRLLADHARAQHQLVRDDLGVGGGFFQNGQEIARQAHGRDVSGNSRR
jgi:hypothetical protein